MAEQLKRRADRIHISYLKCIFLAIPIILILTSHSMQCSRPNLEKWGAPISISPNLKIYSKGFKICTTGWFRWKAQCLILHHDVTQFLSFLSDFWIFQSRNPIYVINACFIWQFACVCQKASSQHESYSVNITYIYVHRVHLAGVKCVNTSVTETFALEALCQWNWHRRDSCFMSFS